MPRRPALHPRRLALLALSAVIALLLARLVMLLFAADPAQPFVATVRALTAPLVAPLAWIDAAQPIDGVRFERGTALLALILIGTAVLPALFRRR